MTPIIWECDLPFPVKDTALTDHGESMEYVFKGLEQLINGLEQLILL